ncbi:uncharacterized protein LOC130962196 [Arachis stenosperma]|nr:uncharacterized protein LOC130962196 [Arachis stenosperma]
MNPDEMHVAYAKRLKPDRFLDLDPALLPTRCERCDIKDHDDFRITPSRDTNRNEGGGMEEEMHKKKNRDDAGVIEDETPKKKAKFEEGSEKMDDMSSEPSKE